MPKHTKTDIGSHPEMSDLNRNPGIGSSKGVWGTGADPRALEGDSTAEGDVGNDTTPEGGVDPNQLGRTNK